MMKKSLLLLVLILGLGIGFSAFKNTNLLEGRFASRTSTYYVSSTGAGSGTSIADPADFQDAINLASSGDRIMLLNDREYAPADTIVINKDLVIQGAAYTTIDCSGTAAFGKTCISYSAGLTTASQMSNISFNNYDVAIEINSGSSPQLSDLDFTFNGLLAAGPHWLYPKAIYVTGIKTNPSISNSTFTGALRDGDYHDELAAVYIDGGAPTLENLTISLQTHGVYITGTGVIPKISNSNFSENYYGIVSENQADPTLILNNTFTCTTALCPEAGGGVFIDGATSTSIKNNRFETPSTGLSIQSYSGSSSVQVSYNNFDTNISGIIVHSHYPNTTHSNIFKNNFSNCSNGISTSGNDESSEISANHFTSNGIGVDASSSSNAVIKNNLIENSTSHAVSLNQAEVLVEYNTIVNSASDGIHVTNIDGEAHISINYSTIVNNILYGNAGNGIYIDSTASTNAQMGYNDAYNNGTDFAGTYTDLGGNISTDPLFTSASDFHLQTSSSLANYAHLFFVTTDIDGTRRDSRGVSTGPEIGAYEIN